MSRAVRVPPSRRSPGARIGNVSTLGVGTFGEVFNATVKIGGQAFPVAVKRQWVTSRWTYDAERKKEAVRREITALSALNGTTGFVGYYGSHVADGKAGVDRGQKLSIRGAPPNSESPGSSAAPQRPLRSEPPAGLSCHPSVVWA